MSDEISLLVHPMDDTYGRKVRKILSCAAGQTSAVFQRLMDENFSYPDGLFAFDARVSVLPHEQAVVDYFRWRQSEATRNCINAYCYWMLREEGKNKREATSELRGKSFSELNEFLFKRDVNFNDLPLWQRRGMGHYFEIYRKVGKNRKTKKKEMSLRRRICQDTRLPRGDDYDDYLRDIIRWGTTDDRTGQLIQQEQRWFNRNELPELLKTDKAGKYVVVYEKEIVEFFEDEDAAYRFAVEKFGLHGHFLLVCVEEHQVYWG
jgi:tRNA(His) 5'-end guanylyltransferase